MSIILPTESSVYMIKRKDSTDPLFFLFDVINTNIDVALWTPTMFKAREFYTEESVEEFKYKYLKNRPCEIIMVK